MVSKLSFYANGNHQEALGQFADIVEIAKEDGILSGDELNLIERMARKLEITDDEYKAVMENPSKYPTNAPVDYEARIERLFYLTKMVLADGFADTCEVKLLKKIAYKLHFTNEQIAEESINLVSKDNDLEEFTLAIKKLK